MAAVQEGVRGRVEETDWKVRSTFVMRAGVLAAGLFAGPTKR
jgi:hypothetical protein